MLKLEQARVHVTSITFGTGHGDIFTVTQDPRTITGADQGWNSQFPRNDCSMAGTAAAVGDDRRGFFHDRLPVGICHVSHQHIAVFDQVHLRKIINNFDSSLANTVTHRTALDNWFAFLLEDKAFDDLAGAGLNRLRTRLNNIHLSVFTILGPFDIHRSTIVFLNRYCYLGECGNFFIINRKLVLISGVDVDRFNRLLRAITVGVDHFD